MKLTNLFRDTREALAALDVKECSRSLYFDRFSRPDLEKDPRKQFFTDGFKAHAYRDRAKSWDAWLGDSGLGLKPADILYAQLQSRLMVNMAGGVMENAGLCLDRFGLPYIPGSAVKGCARRAALAALREWCELGEKPHGLDNLFTSACKPFASPSEMLSAVARVFGWSEQDWSNKKKDGRFVSDFAWACDPAGSPASAPTAPTGQTNTAQGNALGESPDTNLSPERAIPITTAGWPAIRAETLQHLAIAPAPCAAPEDGGIRLKHFAGRVSFLPAYPVSLPSGKQEGLPVMVPELGQMELDVVTCHHGDYYSSDTPNTMATDTEDPIPVFLPAIAAGHIFSFAVLPLRNCPADLLKWARTWLACGLPAFGIGAKTAAGYGWFEGSDAAQLTIAKLLERQQKDEATRRHLAKEAVDQKAREDAERVRRERLKVETAFLSPEEKEDYQLASLNDDQFRGALNN